MGQGGTLGDDVWEPTLLVVHAAADDDERRRPDKFALFFLERCVDDCVRQAEFIFQQHEQHAARRGRALAGDHHACHFHHHSLR